MKIRTHKLHDEQFGNDWNDRVESRWLYDDFKHGRTDRQQRWRTGWISFDCALYEPADDRVYLGITSFASDIFKAFDRKSGKFIDLGYERIVDPYDAKFHRSLERGPDGCLYGAVALLHCVDHFNDAPGGAIVRFDPRSGSIAKLAVLQEHVYIQSIALDQRRQMIYAMMLAPEKLCSFNLRTGLIKDYGLIGAGISGLAQGENLCLDDQGGCWGSWQLTRAWQSPTDSDYNRLCKIDPKEDRLIYYQKGLPRPDGKPGTTKVEGLFNLGDGKLYASGGNGSLFRIDPAGADSEYLSTPVADRPSRLTSLVVGRDGLAYGVVGKAGHCELLRFDFKNGQHELVGGRIRNSDGEPLWQVHQIVMADDGTLYACENDVPHRGGYLWEISDVF